MAMKETEICRVLFTESSPDVGGQELQLLTQANGLRSRGIETLLLCRANSRIAAVAATRGIPTIPVPFRNSFHLPSIAAVRRVLQTFRPDAMICHSGHDANNCAVAARLVTHRPVLLRARTYQYGIPRAFSYNRLFDRTLVPSEDMRERLLANRKIEPHRIHVLYPGIDFDTIASRSQERLPVSIAEALAVLPQPLIVHAAMLRGEKNHALMLDVLAMLKDRGMVAGYAIAGEGPLKEQLQKQVGDLRLNDQVQFLGMVDNIAAVYRYAALVVVPSKHEALGMSQIEALSLDIPVIGSKVGGIPETIIHEETGLIVPPQDKAAWLQTVERALKAPREMRAMAKKGNVDVRHRFGLQTNIDQLLEHINIFRQRPAR